MSDTIQLLAVELLQTNPFQPRAKIKKEEVQELADSIKAYGILEPLIVAQTPAGYQIIAGERRWRAAQLAGLREVPILIRKTTPKGMLEMALIENVQRVDLNPLERAKAFQQLIRDFKFSPSEIATRVGKSPAYVSNSLKLLTLPDAIKDGLAGNMISEGHARAIAGMATPHEMIELYKEILRKDLNVRDTEQRARNLRENHVNRVLQRPEESERSYPGLDNQQLHDWEEQLARVFKSKHKFNLSRSRNQTKVTFWFKGDVDQTQKDIERLMELFKQ